MCAWNPITSHALGRRPRTPRSGNRQTAEFLMINSAKIHVRRVFAAFCASCDQWVTTIPLSTVLGLLTLLACLRFWKMWDFLPWPDSVALYVTSTIIGQVPWLPSTWQLSLNSIQRTFANSRDIIQIARLLILLISLMTVWAFCISYMIVCLDEKPAWWRQNCITIFKILHIQGQSSILLLRSQLIVILFWRVSQKRYEKDLNC